MKNNPIPTIFSVVLIFALSFLLSGDKPDITSLIQLGVVVVLFGVAAFFLWRDYMPILRIKAVAEQFHRQPNPQAYQQELDNFKKHLHLKDYENMYHLLQADLDIYIGQFATALDQLLFVNRQEIKDEDYLTWARKRAKALMFLDQLSQQDEAIEYLHQHRQQLGPFGKFDCHLISAYLAIQNHDEKGYQTHHQALVDHNDPESSRYKMSNAEIAWIEYLAVLPQNEATEIKVKHNMFMASNPYPALLVYCRRHQLIEK